MRTNAYVLSISVYVHECVIFKRGVILSSNVFHWYDHHHALLLINLFPLEMDYVAREVQYKFDISD